MRQVWTKTKKNNKRIMHRTVYTYKTERGNHRALAQCVNVPKINPRPLEASRTQQKEVQNRCKLQTQREYTVGLYSTNRSHKTIVLLSAIVLQNGQNRTALMPTTGQNIQLIENRVLSRAKHAGQVRLLYVYGAKLCRTCESIESIDLVRY